MKKPVNVEPGKQGFQPTTPGKLHIPTPSELAAHMLGVETKPVGSSINELASMHAALKEITAETTVAAEEPSPTIGDPPVRFLTHHNFPPNPYYGFNVISFGYDENTQRLEVLVERENTDKETHPATLYSYQNVPRHVVNDFISSPSEEWQTKIGGFYEYPSKEEADAAGWTTERCGDCGQWKASLHSCPFFYTPLPQPASYPYEEVTLYQWDVETKSAREIIDRVALPHKAGLVHALAAEESPAGKKSAVTLLLDCDIENSQVSGFMTIYLKEDGQYGFVTQQAKCTCPTYARTGTCPHINAIVFAVQKQAGEIGEEEETAYREAGEAFAETNFQDRQKELEEQDWTRNSELYEEAKRTWRTDTDVLYSEDPRAFLRDMQEAKKKAEKNRGLPAIEYARENVLDGMCQRGSGQAFGVEIEYEFPAYMTYEEIKRAQYQIGEQLYNLGLTYSREQQNYGESKARGFRDEQVDEKGVGNWSWERDGSVAGEIVSPGLYDEPATWNNLQLVLRVLKANGAVAGIHSGAHVHVGAAAYKDNPAAYTELARLVSQHEDVIARLSSDPHRGTHRSSLYAQPLPHSVPPEGFRSVPVAYDWQQQSHERYTIINFASCIGDDTDHVEIRAFDSTLDPGTVQAQVMLAVGIVNAAERNALKGGTRRGGESWGTHAEISEAQGTPSSPTAFVKDSGTMMSFIDTVFRRREDKARMAAMAYHTKWSKPMQNDSHYENLEDDDNENDYDDWDEDY